MNADQLKEEGNSAFRRLDWHAARGYYSQAITLSQAQLSVIFSNRAQACLELEDWDLALQDADAALALNPRCCNQSQSAVTCRLMLKHLMLLQGD